LISFDSFRTLDPQAARLTRDLIADADQSRTEFNSFASLWMAFNGWMECITDTNSDAEMINAICDNRRITDPYERLTREADFRQQVERFVAMWPVINVRDAKRKIGREAFSRLSRREFLSRCQRESVKFQPHGWNEGDVPTWPQIIRTIYQIRNNLFHGSKSPQNDRDHQLVSQANLILRGFIDGSRCFEWNDITDAR
jgi:hypothetical protein